LQYDINRPHHNLYQNDTTRYRLEAMANQPLTSNMTDAGNLEKLPLEIRKQIYTHLLVEPKTITIKRYINRRAYIRGEVARMNHHRKADRDRKVYDRRRKAWVDAPPSTTSILLVNKSVGREATPVFYGSNNFFFEHAGALQDFLAWIGQSRQYLRHVEVDGEGIKFNSSWTAMDRSLRLLESSKGLRALHFYHAGFCSRNRCSTELRDLVTHCSPLLKSFQATWEARNLSMKVLDVVKIVLPPCHCSLCPEPEKRCYYYTCRQTSTHGLCRSRWNVLPGGGPREESFRTCSCDCEAAEDKNRSINEELKVEITRKLGRRTNRYDA
jgi:hypothetical protein